MVLRVVLGFTCACSLLVGSLRAEVGPLLFDGPPLGGPRPSQVKLSAYEDGTAPVEIEQAGPEPVPIPWSETPMEEQSPTEPGRVSELKRTPLAIARPELPAEPPAYPKQADAPKQQGEPTLAPRHPGPTLAPGLADDDGYTQHEANDEPPSESLSRVPEAVNVSIDDEPWVLHDACCPPTSRLSIPSISSAGLALPEIPQPCVLDEFGVDLGGWVEAGFSAAGTSPEDRFNGPVTFNDRHAEGQMNQLWFYLERKPNAWACGLDLGGRVDVMYGTDARYIQAGDGLESNWEQSDRFYEMALPQFYLDATLSGWTVRMGRFFTILGYETPAAPDNFFYSHAYTMQYGEPFTHMGMLVSRRFGGWLLNAGFHRGNNQFDDTDGLNALNVLGGIGYTAPGGRASVDYAFSSAENGPGVPSYTHSLVNTVHITRRLDYVLQGDYGEIWTENLRRTAAWWGLNQYLTYTINPCWAAGIRVEWFRDRDGTRVSGLRPGNQTPSALAGDFYEITLGLNWNPRTNLRVRPEVRWDIFDPRDSTTNRAYDAGNLNRQFMFGCDVTYKF